jgi:hypothetical protein
VKTFADTSFFLLFEEILRRDKPKDAPDAWTAAGVSWHHTRHTFEGQSYGFTTEIFEAVCSAKEGWSLIVVKEHWWAGRNGETVRSAHWAKPMRGKRTAILAWLKQRQREVEAER